MFFLWMVLLGLLAYYLYWKITQPLSFWQKKGVKFIKPAPLIGNMKLLRKKAFVELIQEYYNEYPNERYVGLYNFLKPILMLRDPQLIKKITVKDFDSFVDHLPFIPEDIDPMWDKNLLAMTGNKWREMRPTLSPAFTSSKMKLMFILIEEIAQQFVDYLSKEPTDVVEWEMKDFFSRFTNDVIATTAFGLKCDSLKEKRNEFYLMGKEASDFTGIKSLKFFLTSLNPILVKMLGVKFVTDRVTNFFSSIIEDTVEKREKEGIVRPDMLHLLMEAKKGQLKHEKNSDLETEFSAVQESDLGKRTRTLKYEITNMDITAQAMIFFLAGFDTTSTLMSFMAYELAVNPDIQKKLSREVNETLRNCGGKLTYESILKMTYLDMVVSETLRKWPSIPTTNRKATKNFVIEPENSGEQPLLLEKGSFCWLPIFSIHRDPKHYADPNRFDPERFSEENRHRIDPTTYMPFGIGPRNCIGSRFALLETKVIFFYILRNFEIVATKKTEIPVVMHHTDIGMAAQNGIWLGFRKLSTEE